jgi:hypothetical protein
MRGFIAQLIDIALWRAENTSQLSSHTLVFKLKITLREPSRKLFGKMEGGPAEYI